MKRPTGLMVVSVLTAFLFGIMIGKGIYVRQISGAIIINPPASPANHDLVSRHFLPINRTTLQALALKNLWSGEFIGMPMSRVETSFPRLQKYKPPNFDQDVVRIPSLTSGEYELTISHPNGHGYFWKRRLQIHGGQPTPKVTLSQFRSVPVRLTWHSSRATGEADAMSKPTVYMQIQGWHQAYGLSQAHVVFVHRFDEADEPTFTCRFPVQPELQYRLVAFRRYENAKLDPSRQDRYQRESVKGQDMVEWLINRARELDKLPEDHPDHRSLIENTYPLRISIY